MGPFPPFLEEYSTMPGAVTHKLAGDTGAVRAGELPLVTLRHPMPDVPTPGLLLAVAAAVRVVAIAHQALVNADIVREAVELVSATQPGTAGLVCPVHTVLLLVTPV